MTALYSAPLTLGNTTQTVFSQFGTNGMIITKAIVSNTDSSPHTVTVYIVPSGGTAGASNQAVPALNVPALTTVPLPLSGIVLANGDSLAALASVGGVVNIWAGFAQDT